MDKQVEDILKRMRTSSNNVQVFDANDSEGLSKILGQQHKNRPVNATLPKLECHLQPSTRDTDSLVSTTLDKLQPGRRNEGSIIHLRVTDESRSDFGSVVRVTDIAGSNGEVWSLILRPLGVQKFAKDTIIAIKEPYFGSSPSGKLSICLHHPSDCLYVSRLDPVVQEQFRDLYLSNEVDYLNIGNLALVAGRSLEALDYYSRGAECLRKEDLDSGEKVCELLLKRAFCYSRLGACVSALKDVDTILGLNPLHIQALKLGYNAALEHGHTADASQYAERLCAIDPSSVLFKKLLESAKTRHLLASGSYDFGRLVREARISARIPNVRSYTDSIEVRPSNLGGRGLFAKAAISAGQLVLCEKTLALCDPAEAKSFGAGITDILPGEKTNGRVLSLLQQLADVALRDPNHSQTEKIFDLYAGEDLDMEKCDGHERTVFNTYKAVSILKHNLHTIFPGSTSLHHDAGDIANKFPPDKSLPGATDQKPGLWLTASRFNHSCLPNCTWSWIGDLFIARANRDIKAGEELTVTYLPTSYDHQKRNSILKSHNGFECFCDLCRADAEISDIDKAARQTMQDLLRRRLTRYVTQSASRPSDALRSLEDHIKASIKSYNYPSYSSLPKIQLADTFLQVANVYLGSDISNWRSASAASRSKARECFTASLELGLNIRLITHPMSSYCELAFLRYSQAKAVGALALMGLAEMAYNDGKVERCRALKACAKEVYGIVYGEDETFGEKHLSYRCRNEPTDRGEMPEEEVWEEVRRKAIEAEREVPEFLR